MLEVISSWWVPTGISSPFNVTVRRIVADRKGRWRVASSGQKLERAIASKADSFKARKDKSARPRPPIGEARKCRRGPILFGKAPK